MDDTGENVEVTGEMLVGQPDYRSKGPDTAGFYTYTPEEKTVWGTLFARLMEWIEAAHMDLWQVLSFMPMRSFVAANVTISHEQCKETALNISNFVTDRATLIGAADGLIFHLDGRITDSIAGGKTR